MRIDLGEDEEPEIGLIALIDCIFFLLMFFMVATTFKLQEAHEQAQVQRIVLPKADVSFEQGSASAEPFVIGLDQQGGILIDEQPVTLEFLRTRLHALAAQNPHHPIRIDGDHRLSLQQFVHILDLCQFEGLTQISVRTR